MTQDNTDTTTTTPINWLSARTDFLEFDACPSDENPVFDVRYSTTHQRVEALYYLGEIAQAIPPQDRDRLRFRIRKNPHDFGTYVSVAVYYVEDDAESLEQLHRLEDFLCNGLLTWMPENGAYLWQLRKFIDSGQAGDAPNPEGIPERTFLAGLALLDDRATN